MVLLFDILNSLFTLCNYCFRIKVRFNVRESTLGYPTIYTDLFTLSQTHSVIHPCKQNSRDVICIKSIYILYIFTIHSFFCNKISIICQRILYHIVCYYTTLLQFVFSILFYEYLLNKNILINNLLL